MLQYYLHNVKAYGKSNILTKKCHCDNMFLIYFNKVEQTEKRTMKVHFKCGK